MPLTDAELEALLRPAQASAPIDPYGAPIDPYGVSDADLDELLLVQPPPPPPERAEPSPPIQSPPPSYPDEGNISAAGVANFLLAPPKDLPISPELSDQELLVRRAEAGDKEAQALLQQHAADNAPLPPTDQSRWQLPQLQGAPGQSQAIVTQTPQEAGPVDAMAALAALPDDQLIAAIENTDPERRGEMIANLPPERRQVWVQHDNARRQAFADARMDEELREKEADLAEATAKSAEYRQKADAMIAQIAHDAETMQREPIDRRSGFQRAMQGLAAGWGAVVALRTGGPNHAANQIQQAIETDLNRQRIAINTNIRSLENRKGIVNKLYEQSGDLDQAVHTARILMYKQAQEKVAQEMARFDPANTRARTHAQELINLRQKEAAAMASARESAHKRAESAANLWLKTRREDREDRRLAWQMAGRPGAGGSGGRSGVPTPTKLDDNSIATTLSKFPTIKPWGEMIFREQEIYRSRLVNSNGVRALVQYGKPEEAAVLRTQLEDAMTFTGLTNELIGLLTEHGWEPATGRYATEAGARIQTIYTQLLGAAKGKSGLDLGVLTGPDLNIVFKLLGQDPTDLRDIKNIEKLRQATTNMVNKVNNAFTVRSVETAPGVLAKFNPVRYSGKFKKPKLADSFARAERALEDYNAGKIGPREVLGVMVGFSKLAQQRSTTEAEKGRARKLIKTFRNSMSEEDRKKWLSGVPASVRGEFVDTVSEVMNPDGIVVGPDYADEMERELGLKDGSGTKLDQKIEKELTSGNIEAKRAQGVPEEDLHLLFSIKSKKLRQKWGRKYDRTWTDAEWLDYMRRREKNSAAKPPK